MKNTGTDPDIPILYEDNHLLVISKPAGLLSQEDHTGAPDVLTLCKSYIKQRYNKPGNVFLGLVHRLDRPVGGVMVLAKTSKAASRISEQIRKRTVKKRYLAVTEGNPPENGYLEHYITKDAATNTVNASRKPVKNSKPAKLSFLKLEQQQNYALLEINLITGRAHQIRVQLAETGTPIAGDRKYGKDNLRDDIALLAYSFELEHPTTKQSHTFRAPLPESPLWNRFSFAGK